MTVNYSEVVERFRKTLQQSGAEESSAAPFFRETSAEKLAYLTDLYGTFSYWTSVYLNNELEELKKYHVPDRIIEFYQKYEPNHVFVEKAGVSLCDLDKIREVNASYAPGGVLIRYGLLTIATTIGGVAVCIDLNTRSGRVVLVDNSDCFDVDCVESYQDVKEIAHTVAPSFEQFIWKLSGNEYDDFEDTFLDDD